ncbi:hypothetical protein LguiA_012673 [Lonicera macranthoides]
MNSKAQILQSGSEYRYRILQGYGGIRTGYVSNFTGGDHTHLHPPPHPTPKKSRPTVRSHHHRKKVNDENDVTYPIILPIGAPFDYPLPVEPHPLVGLHLVLLVPLHLILRNTLRIPPPLPPPPPLQPPPPRPHPRLAQPLHVPHFRHHLHRHPPPLRSVTLAGSGAAPRPPHFSGFFASPSAPAPLGASSSGHTSSTSPVSSTPSAPTSPSSRAANSPSSNSSTTPSLSSLLVYGFRFWTAIGLPSACFPIVVSCQIVLLGCNLLCHFGVLLLHFMKGGCNGIGAWVFNSVLNAAILFLFLIFYVKKMHLKNRKVKGGDRFNSMKEVEMESVKDKCN